MIQNKRRAKQVQAQLHRVEQAAQAALLSQRLKTPA